MSQFLDNSLDFNVITRKKKGVISCYIYPLYPSRTLESISFLVFYCTEMSVSILYMSGRFLSGHSKYIVLLFTY